MSFANGQKVHLYVKGHDLFEATVTSIAGNKLSVSYSGGSVDDLDLSKMYNAKGDPCFIEHPALKGMGDEVTPAFDPRPAPRAREPTVGCCHCVAAKSGTVVAPVRGRRPA